MIIKVNNNAFAIVEFWEKHRQDSNIFIELRDFDKVEISIDEDNFKGSMEDASEIVKETLFNARLS